MNAERTRLQQQNTAHMFHTAVVPAPTPCTKATPACSRAECVTCGGCQAKTRCSAAAAVRRRRTASRAQEHVPRRSAHIVAAVADDEQVEGVGIAVDGREGDLERNY